MRSALLHRWTGAINGADIHQRNRLIMAAMIAMLLLTSLANMVAAQAVPTVPGFEIEIVDLTVTCDTTVSFDAVVTNTAEIMNG